MTNTDDLRVNGKYEIRITKSLKDHASVPGIVIDHIYVTITNNPDDCELIVSNC